MISLFSYQLILLIASKRQSSHEWLNSRNHWYDTYDYIVVGAGTAGSVVAARLAENESKNILLIEAGGPQNNYSDIPAFQSKLTGTQYDWDYPIEPQKYAYQAFIGNQRKLSRGKAFGGCSMHNSMNYYRENPEYFRLWSDITGVKNWCYEDVLPYFKKSENNMDQVLVANNPTVHTTGGPFTITTVKPLDAILQLFLTEAPKLGYPLTYPDGREPFGSMVMQTTIKDGVRQSTSLAFLEHNRRGNLHILGQTLVTKVLFNERKRAIGVQFYRNKKFYTVLVRKEVIVCAGAVGSPKLLLLSGIGPKEHLQEVGVPLISKLRVGDNSLQNTFVRFYFDVINQSLIEKPTETFENVYKYYIKQGGPLAYKSTGMICFPQVHYPGSPNLCNGAVLPRVGLLDNNLEDMVKDFKLKDDWREYYRPYLNRTNFVINPGLRRSQAVGTIRLSSRNPFQNPIIDPCNLCSERDLVDLVKTFKLSLDVFLSPLFRPYIETYKKPIPGCYPCPDNFFCDSYIRCYIQTFTSEIYPTGGCRIGIDSDVNAVVDERLRVFGVYGLRVIDSSIFPVGTEQSTAITIMVGEYGADLIKRNNSNE